MRHGDTHQKIEQEGEAEYLEGGGTLSIARRDYYFARAMAALKAAENLLMSRDTAISWGTTCMNCASLWDKNYEIYMQKEEMKAKQEGKPWPPLPLTTDEDFT